MSRKTGRGEPAKERTEQRSEGKRIELKLGTSREYFRHTSSASKRGRTRREKGREAWEEDIFRGGSVIGELNH